VLLHEHGNAGICPQRLVGPSSCRDWRGLSMFDYDVREGNFATETGDEVIRWLEPAASGSCACGRRGEKPASVGRTWHSWITPNDKFFSL